MTPQNPSRHAVLEAQTLLHHSWLLGLMLTVVTHKDPEVIGEWMFRLFRRQHLDKFLSSFGKLGLDALPHAVACARYHVLSNQIGGVRVEYMKENDRKAWLRFRYPRWMYAGPTICAMPIEVSRGFLRGWYAHNGVSLSNPRLGFVCVSEDMSDDGFGLCGYFHERDHDLAENERLQFSQELPPAFNAADQPQLPAGEWPPERLAAAQRSYALDYLRNGVGELIGLIGAEEAGEFASRSARLIGRQYFEQTSAMIGAPDGNARDALAYLSRMTDGLAELVTNEAAVLTEPTNSANSQTSATSPTNTNPTDSEQRAGFSLGRLRICQGLPAQESAVLGQAWLRLLEGAVSAHRQLMRLNFSESSDGQFVGMISPR